VAEVAAEAIAAKVVADAANPLNLLPWARL